MGEIKIREAKIEDIKAISTIKVSGWQTAYKNIIDQEFLDNMSVESTIEKNIRNFENSNYLVAELDNEVVGYCKYDFLYNGEIGENIDCELHGLYVKPDKKRNGIGKKLIKFLMEKFKKANKTKMILWCLKENYPSRAFYEAMGGMAGKTKKFECGEKEYEIISYTYAIESELILVFPTSEYKEKVEEYLQEFLDNGEEKIAGDGGLDRIKNFDEWLEKVQNDSILDSSKEDNVPATVYLTVRKSDNKIVGNLQIRHKLNEKLLHYGGHIGDSVRPSERRKGYATEQIRLALQKCKQLGIDNVLMDCDKSNIGSAKSIIKNGGILEKEYYVENELVQKYWISLKKKFVTNPQNAKVIGKGNVKIKNVKNNDFCGDVALISFDKTTEPYIIKDLSVSIISDNYKWLEFFDYNSKIRLIAMYNHNNDIIEWYFDIARKIGKENTLPYEDDLYLDIVVTPNGKIVLLDENELEDAYKRLEVTKEDYDMAYEEVKKLKNRIDGNVEKLKNFTDKYLKMMLTDN